MHPAFSMFKYRVLCDICSWHSEYLVKNETFLWSESYRIEKNGKRCSDEESNL